MNEKKVAVIIFATNSEVPKSILFLETLKKNGLSEYENYDIWFLGSDYSPSVKNFFVENELRFFEDSLEDYLKYFLHRDTTELDILKSRISRLAYLNWYSQYGKDYDVALSCSNSILVQKDISGLIDLQIGNEVYYGKNPVLIAPFSKIVQKDLAYNYFIDETFYSPNYEPNIGFLMSSPKGLFKLMSDFKDFYVDMPKSFLFDYNFNDQDILRVLSVTNEDSFRIFDKRIIFHYVSIRGNLVETTPFNFSTTGIEFIPSMINFSANSWTDFASLKSWFQGEDSMVLWQGLTMEEKAEALEKYSNNFKAIK